LLGQVVLAVRPVRPAGHGASWEALGAVRAEVAGWVGDGVTLVKIGELLARRGVDVPYRTLARFAAAECGYSSARARVTVPVADGEPGGEVQVDFGYLGMIVDEGRRRKLHALVFTAVFSRYCFVFLTFSQTTLAVIAGCEAAWEFFGGVFKVVVPDNLKPVVDAADRLEPRWNREWLEYAQARGLVVDPARVASPQDKGRVEAGVKFVQRSFFAGEQFTGVVDAQRRVEDWCRHRAGMRVHGTTRARPAEVFAQLEAPVLSPVPQEPYRVPAWSEAKVARDFHVRAQNAFYSVPYRLVGQQVTVRADGTLVKIYHRGQVIRTHPQKPAGGRSSDPGDFPPDTDVYARRDVDKLAGMAAVRGEAIGIYAARVLDTPLPWTRMRAVYTLIGLARTYGNEPVEQACAAALELDVISVAKIRSIVEKGTGAQAAQTAARHSDGPARKTPAARFARDSREFATATGVQLQILPGGDA
jgi:transposase